MSLPTSSPPVQTGDVEQQVSALRRMRREASFWRYGSLAVVALTVAYSIATLRNSAQALLEPGPVQTEFTTLLSTSLQKEVVPNVQGIATRTLTEMRPEVTASFEKLNTRTPELAQASMEQFELLQQNIPARSEKVLDETFSAELKKREGKIKEMFPDVTEEKIQTLVTNLTAAGEKRIPNVADQIMSRHLEAMNGIVTDIATIQQGEKVSASGDVATWEMSLAVLDLLRDDLRELAPAEAKTGGKSVKPTDAPAKKKTASRVDSTKPQTQEAKR